jgi:hypothetical protein
LTCVFIIVVSPLIIDVLVVCVRLKQENTSSDDNDPQQPGDCRCFAGWKGSRCEELDLLPVIKDLKGLQLPNHVSTWGGSVIERDGTWHMFASQMVEGCGLDYWMTNSQVIRAVSDDSPFGPYRFQEVILPTFAHDANVIEAPTGEVVLFVTALKGVTPHNCTATATTTKGKHTTTTAPPLESPPTNIESVPPKDTYMLWAPHPTGPWSKPVMVLNSTKWNSDYWNRTGRVAHCDSNLNGIIHPDGSFLGLWRRCETPDLLTIPHRLTASDWRNASSYQPHVEDPLFVLGGSGAEDPSNIWSTHTASGGTAFHAIFHDEQSTRCMLPTGCSANGRHAFLLDGRSWRYASTDAYTRNVNFDDTTNTTTTTTLIANTRARPHLIIDRQGHLLALSTGLKPEKNSDYVWTLVQPLRRESGRPQQDYSQPSLRSSEQIRRHG